MIVVKKVNDMNRGYVAILLDETGSMTGQEDRVVGGINEYVNKLRTDQNTEYEIVIRLFDSERWRTFFSGTLTQCPTMEAKHYRPGAMTPLYDAIGRIVSEAEEAAAGRQVLVLIDTDGMENASREHTQESIKAQITQKESAGWTFVFLGSGIDIVQAQQVALQASAIGVLDSATMNVDHSRRKAVYGATGNATIRRFTEGPVKSSGRFYTEDELKKGE